MFLIEIWVYCLHLMMFLRTLFIFYVCTISSLISRVASPLDGQSLGNLNWANTSRHVKHFKACAYAPNERIFHECMAKFKELGGDIAVDFLDQLPVRKWVVAFSPLIHHYGEMTSNAAESFNNWILKGRSLPITHMIDYIRSELSRWFVERRTEAENWNELLVPKKHALWNDLLQDGKSWSIAQCSNNVFHVKSDVSVVVNLYSKTCSCFQWQLAGFPCSHAVAVLSRKANDISDYVDPGFFTSSYRNCYKEDIHSIPQTLKYELQNIVDDKKIFPPVLKRQPGRPKMKRNPSYGEHGKMRKTSNTHQV